MNGSIFSGEPLPIAPRVDSNELSVFHRKLLDYLRRLSGILDREIMPDGGGGGPPSADTTPLIFSAFTDTTQDCGVSAETILVWNTTLRKDSIYDFTDDDGHIQLNRTGHYVVTVDIAFLKNLPCAVNLYELDNTGAIINVITHCLGEASNTFVQANAQESSTRHFPINATAGDYIGVGITPYVDTLTALAHYCRITVTYYPPEPV